MMYIWYKPYAKSHAMKKLGAIDRYGGVLKEEPLSCITNDILMKNTCALEAVSPYFGYYDETPRTNRPKMLYLMLADYFPLEKLIRATVKVQEKVKFPIGAVTGNITMFNQTCYVIRLINLQNYSQIHAVQELYDKEGVQFKSPGKKFANEMAMIKLRCFFTLIPYGDGIYKDQADPNIGFFELPYYVPWDNFKKITDEVKFDTDLLYFDAATAYFYQDKGVVDMVRIYRENLDEEKLKMIRNRYLKVLETIRT
jgi:hypothetical protein